MSRALIVVVLLAACAHEPRSCQPTHTLYVVNHGWHSGIVVDRMELLKKRPGLGSST